MRRFGRVLATLCSLVAVLTNSPPAAAYGGVAYGVHALLTIWLAASVLNNLLLTAIALRASDSQERGCLGSVLMFSGAVLGLGCFVALFITIQDGGAWRSPICWVSGGNIIWIVVLALWAFGSPTGTDNDQHPVEPLPPKTTPGESRTCPGCGSSMRADLSFCPTCDYDFGEQDE